MGHWMGSAFEGYIEIIGEECLEGWVWCKTRPNETFEVEISASGCFVASVRADLYREDLAKDGKGDGCFGFKVILPKHFRGQDTLVLNARVKGEDYLFENCPYLIWPEGT